jgi:hypothetical protein
MLPMWQSKIMNLGSNTCDLYCASCANWINAAVSEIFRCPGFEMCQTVAKVTTMSDLAMANRALDAMCENPSFAELSLLDQILRLLCYARRYPQNWRRVGIAWIPEDDDFFSNASLIGECLGRFPPRRGRRPHPANTIRKILRKAGFKIRHERDENGAVDPRYLGVLGPMHPSRQWSQTYHPSLRQNFNFANAEMIFMNDDGGFTRNNTTQPQQSEDVIQSKDPDWGDQYYDEYFLINSD